MNEQQLKKEQREAAKRAKLDTQDIDQALAELVSTERGRKLVRWLLTLTQIGRNPFSTNALTTAFQSGELNIGLQLQARIISVAPDAYVEMLKEPTNVRSQSDHRYDSSRDDDHPSGDDDDSGE